VFQTANPLFDVHWSLPALSYDALLELELRDAANDRLLGVFDTTAFELLQRDADAVAAHCTPLPRYVQWRVTLPVVYTSIHTYRSHQTA
jgi:hypothetical protein